MNKEDIGKYIAKLLYQIDVKNNQIGAMNNFINRLKDNDCDKADEKSYEIMKLRDKYLREEIDIFLLNVGER